MKNNPSMVKRNSALKGRSTPMPVTQPHFVNHTILNAAVSQGHEIILLGMGCFWGAERLFWQLEGVISTSVGYAGGYTPNPTYQEVCTGNTGHTEVVRVVFDPNKLNLETLLTHFWEQHDPTQGMRQGNDLGTQYRSAIYTYTEAQKTIAEDSKQKYQTALGLADSKIITTEISQAREFYFAETYHQQYLARNPEGYCGLGGTGVCFPQTPD